MRILLVNTFHFRGGGDSTYTLNLAELLRSKGHQAAFFAMQDPRNLHDPNSDLFVSPINFREMNRRKGMVAGLQVISRVVYSHEARRKIGLLIDRFHPDIIHLQNIHGHITPSVVFEAKARGLPVVWTLHDYKLICPNSHFLVDSTGQICESCGKSRYHQAALKRCKKSSLLASSMATLEAYAHRVLRVRERVDAFFAPGAFLRNKLIERGFAQDRVHHLPLFLSEEMLTQRNGLHNDDYMLFLGKIEPIKGIHTLLQACRLAPGIRLVLAGRLEEPLASELQPLLPPNAHYVGMKQGEELHQLLRNALAVVVPSLWYENQPFSVLEAFAYGKPVIASRLGGMTELLGNDERGKLVAPRDARMLAERVHWMATYYQESRDIGRRARRYLIDRHAADQHYQKVMECYNYVVNDGQAVSPTLHYGAASDL